LEYNLTKMLSHVEHLLRKVDHSDSKDMFDCLIEIELFSRNSVAEHSLNKLLEAVSTAKHYESPYNLPARTN